MKSLSQLLGLEPDEEDVPEIDAGKIGVALTNVTLPLDLALELAFRQQSQIFSEFNQLKAQMAVIEATMTIQGERLAHNHEDILEVQGTLNAATKHPAERVEPKDPEEGDEGPKRKVH